MHTDPWLQAFVPHPIDDRDYWQSIATHPAFADLIKDVNALAERASPTAPLPVATDFLIARRANNRAPMDKHWHARDMFGALAVRRCILGIDPADTDDRLLNWIFALTFEPTWVVSAHLPNNDLPLSGAPQLDLAATEMAATLAETIEVLAPWINQHSQTLVPSVIAEIDRRVLGPFAQNSAVVWWGDPARETSNWNGVCAGAVLIACLALRRMGHPRPLAEQNAIAVLNRFFATSFTPTGECDEGVVYWDYGVSYAIYAMQRLTPQERAHYFDLGRVKQVAAYPGRAHLFDNHFFAGNDSQLVAAPKLSFTPWLASLTDDPFLAWWSAHNPIALTPRNIVSQLRSFAYAPLAKQISDTVASGPALHAPPVKELPDQQVLIARRPTPAGELIVALTGGHNAELHNHNDLGHFIVALGKQILIPDMGAPYYTADFFGPKRYTYLPASSDGHCCPIINGQTQRPGRDAAARVIERSLEPGAVRYRLNLTTAYPSQANLQHWERALSSTDDGYHIDDTFQLTQSGDIQQLLWLAHKPRIDGTTIDCQKLRLTLDPAPVNIVVEPFEPAALNLRPSGPTETLYRVALTYHASANQPLHVNWFITTLP